MRRLTFFVLAAALTVAVAASAAVWHGARPVVGACATASVPAPGTYQVRAADGNCLQGYVWAPADAAAVKAVVVVIHGLHDHARRYAPLARALNAEGIAVLAADHRGHGGSGGASQRIDQIAQAVADVELSLAEAARRFPGKPLFVHGHSMGGLVAAHLSIDSKQPLAGVILSSAALQRPADASDGRVRVLNVIAALAPGLGVEPVDEARLVRTPAARAALAADPVLAREPIPARTVSALLAGIDALQPRVQSMRTPMLLMHGTADTVTPAAGTQAVAKQAPGTVKRIRLFEGALHDLLNEPEAAEVTREIASFVTTAAGAR